VTQTITFRLDNDAERALAVLMEGGRSISAAIRAALIEAAQRRAHQRLRDEATALARDEADRTEAAAILRDMETLRAW
jgi:Arc/MetJ-type ribon-helix-helix transcriptional regulator